MAILPRDLLDQAEGLLARAESLPDIPERKALLRTATSRVYYAVYHEALVRARRDGYTRAPADYGSHDGLWNWWFVEEDPRIDLSMLGTELKERRVRADYRLRETFRLAGVHEAVEDAKAAFDLIQSRGIQ